jgi:hypothetical protein
VTLRLGRATANPALREAGPEAGATDLHPDQSYSVIARVVLTHYAGFLLLRKNWDSPELWPRSHKRDDRRDPLLVAAPLTGILFFLG